MLRPRYFLLSAPGHFFYTPASVIHPCSDPCRLCYFLCRFLSFSFLVLVSSFLAIAILPFWLLPFPLPGSCHFLFRLLPFPLDNPPLCGSLIDVNISLGVPCG
ncbi:hypothetical protein GCWU000342_01355 [Shuttleworthella satelles DSM 14600]|uniref:Transmembrane protein n=1 Tax=Shuttleworthella satelles DSM 14600 TaxID=626523 RepID=C4GBQ2_9FIRM|nr:hypothetical protein GCWU000342_01355 [Shuttleworthia satelles DSM 14600]